MLLEKLVEALRVVAESRGQYQSAAKSFLHDQEGWRYDDREDTAFDRGGRILWVPQARWSSDLSGSSLREPWPYPGDMR